MADNGKPLFSFSLLSFSLLSFPPPFFRAPLFLFHFRWADPFIISEAPHPEWYQHNLLSDPKYGDVTFQFDKKNLTAHSSVLCVRCRVLYQMYEKAQPKKKKDRKGVTHLTINQPHAEYPITAEVFELVLRYLYADDIQFETLSGRQVLLFLLFLPMATFLHPFGVCQFLPLRES